MRDVDGQDHRTRFPLPGGPAGLRLVGSGGAGVAIEPTVDKLHAGWLERQDSHLDQDNGILLREPGADLAAYGPSLRCWRRHVSPALDSPTHSANRPLLPAGVAKNLDGGP